MAINPMKLLELKNLWGAFTRRHPKFPQFISAVQQAGISEGTVIEVQNFHFQPESTAGRH